MGRLALIWDGVWLTWTTFDSSHSVGRREISRQDMIPEVLRALRNQVGAGAQVCHAEWARPASAIPLAMLPDHPTKESWEPLHAMHHGRLSAGSVLTGHALTSLSNDVLVAVSGDQAWQEAVEGVFPNTVTCPWCTCWCTMPCSGTVGFPGMPGRFAWTSVDMAR